MHKQGIPGRFDVLFYRGVVGDLAAVLPWLSGRFGCNLNVAKCLYGAVSVVSALSLNSGFVC